SCARLVVSAAQAGGAISSGHARDIQDLARVMIQIRRLAHASFETPDLDKSIAYYTETNGLVVAAREKSRVFLASRLGRLAVVLESGSAPRCIGLAFEAAPGADFEQVRRELSRHGIVNEPRTDAGPGLGKGLAFADFKNTTIELFSHCDFVP